MMIEKPYRVALVGCGVISATHLSVLSDADYAEVVALCDIKREKAEKRAAEYCPDAAIYTDYEKMLDEVHPDAVHIATPHYLHAKMAAAALRRGINVLLEKPACMTEDEISLILQAEKESSGRITVSFQNRENPAMRKMAELIGEYGGKSAVTAGRAMVSWHRDAAYYSDDWHGKIATEGGGVLINQAIHTLDLLLQYCGRPVSVCGSVANRHLRDVIEVEDSADLLIDCENGVKALFSASTAYTTDSPNFIEIIVGGHMLVLYGERLYRDGEPVALPAPVAGVGKACYGSGHTRLIYDFYTALRTGGDMPVTLDSALDAVRVLLAAYRSDNQTIHI